MYRKVSRVNLNSFVLLPPNKIFVYNVFTLVADRSKGKVTTMLNSQKFLSVSLQDVFRLLKGKCLSYI